MIDLPKNLESLSERRPVFHSEADFQFALAREIARSRPEVNVRSERPVKREEEGRKPADLWIEVAGEVTVVELKYWPWELTGTFDGERYHHPGKKRAGAGRYNFVRDVRRVERHVSEGDPDRGAALALTNASRYWAGHLDAKSALTEGIILEGLAAGGEDDPRDPIRLEGSYRAEWREYSRLESADTEFRYLLLTTD